MLRIAIVEDNSEDSNRLHSLLNDYLLNHNIPVEIYTYATGEDFLLAAQPDYFDICFLDIFLDDSSGMDIARSFVKIDPSCLIIFLTASPDYMSDGYDVRAWRYLLKPLSSATLQKHMPATLDKVLLSQRRLDVVIDRRPLSIPYSQIVAVITVERHVEIQTMNMTFSTGAQVTFEELARPLCDDSRFLVIGRGQIVNLAHVLGIEEGNMIMRNGERLPISRRRFAEVNGRFIGFRLDNS